MKYTYDDYMSNPTSFNEYLSLAVAMRTSPPLAQGAAIGSKNKRRAQTSKRS